VTNPINDFFMQLPVPSEEIDMNTSTGMERLLDMYINDELREDPTIVERPLAEFNGKKGFWITKGGRRIFIVAKKEGGALGGFWNTFKKISGYSALAGALIGGAAVGGLQAFGPGRAKGAVDVVGAGILGAAGGATVGVLTPAALTANAVVALAKGGAHMAKAAYAMIKGTRPRKGFPKFIIDMPRAFGDEHKTYWTMPDLTSMDDLDKTIKEVTGFTDGNVCIALDGGVLEVPRDYLVKGLNSFKLAIMQADTEMKSASKQEPTGL
jgi:hypothetical protein